MSPDPQAFLECLGEMGPPGLLGPRDPQVLQEKRGNQARLARKATWARWAPQDPREVRETLAPSALLGSTAWQEPQDQQDLQGPQAPPGLQDQDSLQDLTTWKAPGDPSGRQPEVLTGRRDRPACPESRGILEPQGHQGPREKSEQTELPASLAERARLEPRDPKEKKGPRERKATQGRMEWDSQASPAPPGPLGLSSTCRSRIGRWRVCRAPRAARGLQAFPDLPGQKETWAPEASRAPRGPRVRRVSRAWSSAPTGEQRPWPRREPRVSLAFEDPRAHMGGQGTRERSASLDGRVAPG